MLPPAFTQMQQLFGTSNPATGYDASGLGGVAPINPLGVPDMGAPASTAAPVQPTMSAEGAPKILASLKPRAKDAFGAMTAGKGTVPGKDLSKSGALAAGFGQGLSDAGTARASSAALSLADAKQRMDQLKELFNMDRTVSRDATDAEYKKGLTSQGERRTAAYERSVDSPTKGVRKNERDIARQEKDLQGAIESERKKLGLDADDEALPSKKMPPAARAEREKRLEAYEADLRKRAGLTPGEASGTTEEGEPANTTAAGEPAFDAAPGAPSPVSPPTRSDMQAESIAAAKDAIARGAPADAVRQRLIEQMGFAPENIDF